MYRSKAESIIVKFISGWLVASLCFQIGNLRDMLKLKSVQNINLFYFILIMAAVIICLYTIDMFLNYRWFGISIFLVLLTFYAALVIYSDTSIYIGLGMSGVVILVYRYFINQYEGAFSKIRINKYVSISIVSVFIICWLAFMITMTVLKYMTFRSPCFDFGIFSQMYYYMKETFMPLVTCERGKLLSHFKVHMSPALYLLLPIYMIFPSPITIIVMQVLVLISGIIPLYLLCKKKELSKGFIVGICLVYILFPAIAGGCFYDFHENKMLLPIILWLFYFIEKRKNIGIIVMTILTLLVKEDAAVYVACIGLYLIASKKEYKRGTCMLVVSIIYFFGVLYYLTNYGDGAMLGRYANYMPNNGGIAEMVITLIKNPAYLFGQIFTGEKIEFMLWMFVPIMGFAFKTKRITDYVLLIPMLVINLMSDNPYQHSIYFQYTYGATAIIFYLLIENISMYIQRKENYVKAKKLLVYMCIASAFMFVAALGSKTFYRDEYKLNSGDYKVMRQELDKIPQNASVIATTWQVAYLSSRDEIYSLQDTDFKDCDYVVYDLRFEEFQKLCNESQAELKKMNYSEISKYDGILAVYYKKGE